MLNARPFFSVITVCYNAAATIQRTAASLHPYPGSLMEWVVVDGASTDNTLALLQQSDRQPDVLVSEADEGLYDAMNKGVDLASGQYLLFLNSDDWLAPHVLHAIQEQILAHPGHDVYHGWLKSHFDQEVVLQKAHGRWPTSMPCFQPASFIRKSLPLATPWFDTRYRIAADFKFFKKLQRLRYRFFALEMVVTHYATDGISSDDGKRMEELKRILPELGYAPWLAGLFVLRMQLFIRWRKRKH